MRSGSFLASLLACATLLLAAPAAQGAEPLKIRIAWTTVAGNLPALFEKKEILRHYGTSYTVEHIHFAGGGPMITALATGEIDLSPFSAFSFGATIQNVHLDDVRIVLDGYQDGVSPYYSSKFMVRADSPIKEIEDLKGKVALVGSVSPYSQDIERRGIGRTLFDQGAALGGPSQGLFHGMRAGFIAQHRAAVQDFVEDYLRALRWFLDPANRDEAPRVMSAYAHEPQDMFATVLTHDDFYRDPDGRPNLDTLEANMRALKEFGLLAADADVKSHADLSLVDEAVKRIQ